MSAVCEISIPQARHSFLVGFGISWWTEIGISYTQVYATWLSHYGSRCRAVYRLNPTKCTLTLYVSTITKLSHKYPLHRIYGVEFLTHTFSSFAINKTSRTSSLLQIVFILVDKEHGINYNKICSAFSSFRDTVLLISTLLHRIARSSCWDKTSSLRMK